MRLTTILRAPERAIKSVALSVYFQHPAFGMKDYEILSRATAFLLSVDGKSVPTAGGAGSATAAAAKADPYSHLEAAEQHRQEREYKSLFGRSLPTGPGRLMMDMGWLEFVPREYRPTVHVVCSSHVVAPYLWKNYYPQEWLSKVREEHCKYTLEVYDTTELPPLLASSSLLSSSSSSLVSSPKPMVQLELNSQPFHHPEGRDMALLHFREENEALKILKGLGLDILHLRDNQKPFRKDEQVVFDGFRVTERNLSDSQAFDNNTNKDEENVKTDDDSSSTNTDVVDDDDQRIFHPHRETGTLAFHLDDRFLATTAEPLSEGMCGCPVLDQDGDCCGTVEGIVPLDNPNKDIAGTAAFQPSYMMKLFVDFVERNLVELISLRLKRLDGSCKQHAAKGGIKEVADLNRPFVPRLHDCAPKTPASRSRNLGCQWILGLGVELARM